METKIIKAVFGGSRYTVTAKRTRTDYGQVLEISGVDLPSTFECIFSNSATSAGVGKKMIGSAQRVLIPDEYLTTGQTIYAWILLHDGEDDGRHMYNVKIPVADMPNLSPEEPTPVEQSVISQAITALNSAVETTTQKASEASASADRAEQAAEGTESYAERAESAQQAAESARDIALEAKVSAQASAATASEKASEAISSATTASQSAITAENASESAQASATASAESASQASQSADTASGKASDASEYASNANASAQTASQKASEATQSASTASQAKTDAETAKQASETAQGRAESARDGAVTAKEDAESARDEAQTLVDGITGKVEQIDSNTDRIESLEDDRYKPYAVDSTSGSIASFPDGADGIPLKSCIVQIEPVQEGSGDPSPENVRPISGWTGCEVQRTGKNVWDEEWERGTYTNDTGKKVTAQDYWRSKNMISVKPLQTYYFMTSGDYIWRFMYDENKQYVGYLTGIVNKSWRVPSNVHYINIVNVSRSAYDSLTKPVSINYPSTDHDYHPYTGTTLPITFPSEAGTVYGAYVDVTGGKLIVEMLSVTIDSSKIIRDTATRYHVAKSYIGDFLTSGYSAMNKFRLKTSSDNYSASGTYFMDTNNLQMNAYRGFDTRAEFIEEYGELQFVFTLATPIEIQLDAHTVNSLYGQNNLWSDTGDVSVEYRADTRLYIEKLTQPEEDDMIADSVINSGQFFMVGNSLYRALANIASGATITVGTNAQRVSLSDALNLVNA